MTKAELRASVLAKRAAVPAGERASFAQRIADVGPRIVLDYAPANATLVVSLFQSVGSEPDLAPLAMVLHAAGVMMALPVTGSRGQPLAFHRWTPGDPTTVGRFGIAEPQPSAPTVEPDMLFVPLVAFDRRGHRIGYGAGYYDLTLAELRARKPLRAIGVAFALQEVLFIPSEPHDERLDLILTNRETLICGE